MKSPVELTELFRAQGMKVTPQRQAIFSALHGNRDHPTADAVYETVSAQMPTISLRTVYQTLNDLASMCELAHVRLGTGSARFDPNLEPHHHLVCDGCGSVVDLAADFTDVRVPDGEHHGFAVRSTEIVFRGRCPACRASAPDDPSTSANHN